MMKIYRFLMVLGLLVWMLRMYLRKADTIKTGL